MYNRMLVTGDFGNRHFNTLAALIFWKICEYSQRYRNKLTLNEVCQKHKHLEEQGMSTSDIQKYIDITPDNVKKVFKEEVDKNFRQLYLPDWEGRIHLKCSTEKSEDDD